MVIKIKTKPQKRNPYKRQITVIGNKKRNQPIKIIIPDSFTPSELAEIKKQLSNIIPSRTYQHLKKKKRKNQREEIIRKRHGAPSKRALKGFEKSLDEEIHDIELSKKKIRDKWLSEIETPEKNNIGDE